MPNLNININMLPHSIINSLIENIKKEYDYIQINQKKIRTTDNERLKDGFKADIESSFENITYFKQQFEEHAKEANIEKENIDFIFENTEMISRDYILNENEVKVLLYQILEKQISFENRLDFYQDIIVKKIDNLKKVNLDFIKPILQGLNSIEVLIISSAIESNDEELELGSVDEVNAYINKIKNALDKSDIPQKEEIKEKLFSKELTIKSQLKLSIPIIPGILSYEAGIDGAFKAAIPKLWEKTKCIFKKKPN